MGEWTQYLALDHEFDTEEYAIDFIERIIPKGLKERYYIVQVKRFEK